MRLNNLQITKIKKAIYTSFGDSVPIYLFGSRVDDSQKGGDIDLLVITSEKGQNLFLKKNRAISGIQLSIGDQKIDMLTAEPDLKNPPLIIKEALKGIEL